MGGPTGRPPPIPTGRSPVARWASGALMLYPRASDSPVQIAWADDEREILRELARRYADIAALPVQDERRDLWTRLNGLDVSGR